jgi:hypothetical protein
MSLTSNKIKENSILNDPSDLADMSESYAEIAEIAYYKAEKRGFEPGHELDDWFEAEQEYMQELDKYR